MRYGFFGRVRLVGQRVDADFRIAFFEQRVFLRLQNLHVKLIAFQTEFGGSLFNGFLFVFSLKFVCHHILLRLA